MPDVIATLEGVTKIYQKPGTRVSIPALRGIDLTIHAGEFMAICGPSGSGKSTLMNILGCMDRPTSGRYVLGGQDVSQMTDDELSAVRGTRLGFVFQNFNLIAQLNVLENLEVPLFYQRVSRDERRRRAERVIEQVGLADRADHRPMELSGGQQQRAAIARAMINDPLILLADEPTGNLDTVTGQAILDIFDGLHAVGRTILMVTHEAEVATRCQRTVTLRDGLVVEDMWNPPRQARTPSDEQAAPSQA
jgi:putative ABC transport system ATP-binding protein